MSPLVDSTSTVDAGDFKIPVIGLGTWQTTDEETELAINAAIDAGYRHIDTAYVYSNENAIGNALKKVFASGKIKREDIFITTKLPPIANNPQYVEKYMKKSLESLKLDYVDLYLVHTPCGMNHHPDGNPLPKKENGDFDFDMSTDLIAVWKAMEDQVDAGRTKAIGISNFNKNQIQRILKSCRIRPANLQVELHAYLQQKELVQFCNENKITIVAYAPIGSPGYKNFAEKINADVSSIKVCNLLEDPVVTEIAKAHSKTSAQVLLRFLLQTGVSIIPKSVNPARIKQNIEVFDFSLSPSEMDKLRGLDKGENGRIFDMTTFKSAKDHPEYPFRK